MSATGPRPFDSTLQLTNTWLNELAEEMDCADRARSYQALRAVLHALRDRLTVGQVAALGAQLPMLVRGFYYEGWQPRDQPRKAHTPDDFLAEVAMSCHDEPERVTRAVLRLLRRHLSAGEIRGIEHALPAELRCW
jgi:uncharacterized protein (DUF2267 family)